MEEKVKNKGVPFDNIKYSLELKIKSFGHDVDVDVNSIITIDDKICRPDELDYIWASALNLGISSACSKFLILHLKNDLEITPLDEESKKKLLNFFEIESEACKETMNRLLSNPLQLS